MQLSIIIVNYNSKMLIEVCVASINKAITGIDNEIIIVDNASTDASKESLEGIAMEDAQIKEQIEGKTIRKVITVPGKLVNIVEN